MAAVLQECSAHQSHTFTSGSYSEHSLIMVSASAQGNLSIGNKGVANACFMTLQSKFDQSWKKTKHLFSFLFLVHFVLITTKKTQHVGNNIVFLSFMLHHGVNDPDRFQKHRFPNSGEISLILVLQYIG